jgi:uncharacterized membrane protein
VLVSLLHAAVTAFMAGLIWMVQLVHYPLFDRVEPGAFPDFHAAHSRRIALIVVPAMTLEALLALLLVLRPPEGVPPWLAGAGLLLVVVNSLSTALLQVPLHRRLAREFDPSAHRALVLTNTVRTSGWSVRVVIAFAILALTGQ